MPHSKIRPLNCCEIIRTRRMPARALRFLALTKANKESLVFAVPPTSESPGVVFSADSDFAFEFRLETEYEYIVTAPHHGSESNAAAYQRLDSILGNAIVVRSDGRCRSRPGKSFLSLPSDQRFCTLCRGNSRPKQSLEFQANTRSWLPEPTVQACMCR